MMYKFFRQGVPGGGLGCLLGAAFIFFILFYALKGLYQILWWAAPALVVLTLIVNWRVVPDTLNRWVKSLQTAPLSALVSAAFAVLAFPFFALWLFLKALGYRQIEQMKRDFSSARETPEEFVDFEEIESRPKEQKVEHPPVDVPPAPKKEKSKKGDNPYDTFFE
jgi:hypothetical protein